VLEEVKIFQPSSSFIPWSIDRSTSAAYCLYVSVVVVLQIWRNLQFRVFLSVLAPVCGGQSKNRTNKFEMKHLQSPIQAGIIISGSGTAVVSDSKQHKRLPENSAKIFACALR